MNIWIVLFRVGPDVWRPELDKMFGFFFNPLANGCSITEYHHRARVSPHLRTFCTSDTLCIRLEQPGAAAAAAAASAAAASVGASSCVVNFVLYTWGIFSFGQFSPGFLFFLGAGQCCLRRRRRPPPQTVKWSYDYGHA